MYGFQKTQQTQQNNQILTFVHFKIRKYTNSKNDKHLGVVICFKIKTKTCKAAKILKIVMFYKNFQNYNLNTSKDIMFKSYEQLRYLHYFIKLVIYIYLHSNYNFTELVLSFYKLKPCYLKVT